MTRDDSTQEALARPLTEDEVRLFLREIEDGTIRLVPPFEPQSIYAGNVEYRASNGWWIVVFNDCNEWDYIDEIVSADGRVADNDAIDGWPGLAGYTPSDEVAWERYRIPGYLQFRCTGCGRVIPTPTAGDLSFCCATCPARPR